VAAAINDRQLGSNNGIVLTAARYRTRWRATGLLPRWLADCAPALPHADSVARRTSGRGDRLTLISTDPSWKNTYNHLFTYVVLAEFVFYGMSCGAVIVLRRKEPAWCALQGVGYPVTPIVFILFALWLLYNTPREQPGVVAMSTLLVSPGCRSLVAAQTQPPGGADCLTLLLASAPGFCRRCSAVSTSFRVSGYLTCPRLPATAGIPS